MANAIPCQFELANCTGHRYLYDFSSLMNQVFSFVDTRDLQFHAGVCQNAEYACNRTNTPFCFQNKGNYFDGGVLATQEAYTVNPCAHLETNRAIALKYSDGMPNEHLCDGTKAPYSIVQIHCDRTAMKPHVWAAHVYQGQGCHYLMQIRSVHGCGKPS
jgi:hypothetical protein